MVPQAELHVHLEGTASPELVRRIAARNGLARQFESALKRQGG
ncbi:MAG: hypothetical protein KY433_06755 [Actinobacteria bacterium]|nr:hypothetical protein [Actinomycetota bacterium]